MPSRDAVASLDVDAQNTFTPLRPQVLPVPGGNEIVAELNAQAQYARYRIGSEEAHNPKAVWVATPKSTLALIFIEVFPRDDTTRIHIATLTETKDKCCKFNG